MDLTSGEQQSFIVQFEKESEHRSTRVKSVDLHPTEPWVLVSLYSGTVHIWNYQSQSVEKSFSITESPVRSAKFIARKNWFVAGTDDKLIHVYNYITMEKIKEFEAHTDYIRSLAVHPTLPYVLSSSDDMVIKLWDWEKDWDCIQVFKGHSHYVMQAAFNPNDSNTFASASLDGKIMQWTLRSTDPILTLDANSKGVNCIDFFTDADKSYLVTGYDDYTAKVWDCQNVTCLQTLESHTHNVSAVSVHPALPVIVTGSEDGTVQIWDATSYRLLNTLNSGLGRVWTIGCLRDSPKIIIGCDEGTIFGKVIC